MPRNFRNLIFLGAMAALLLLGTPAMAQTTPTDACADGSMDKSIQSTMAQAAWNNIKAANQGMDIYGSIDVRNGYCITAVMNMFDRVMAMSDPNGFASMIMSALESMIAGELVSLIDAGCSAVVGAAGAITTSLLSQLNRICIPIPSFGVIGGFSLSLPIAAPCSGLSPLSVGYSSMPMSPVVYDPRKFFPPSTGY